MDIDGAREDLGRILKYQAAEFGNQSLSESDTRSKLIDAVLLGPMGWQEHSIRREANVVDVGYVDYTLYTSKPSFIIEAKKNTVHFNLPNLKNTRRLKIGGVLSNDKALKAAIDQCRGYALARGVSLCCVSNGLQYVFFRAHNEEGIPFSEHKATVFSSPADILSNFVDFYEILSFDSASEGRNFSHLPVSDFIENSTNFKELSAAAQRAGHRSRNRLFPFVKDVVGEVFQDLAGVGADQELIEQCYVESPKHDSYEQSLRTLVRRKPGLSPGTIEPLKVSRRSAGAFDRVLNSSGSKASRSKEVVMLLGGIGAGKTTFIKRFRKVIARERIEKNCLWIELNFNRYSEAPGALEPWVYSSVLAEIDSEYPDLDFGSFRHLKLAYASDYDRLKRGRLAPLFSKDPAQFDIAFGEEIARYEQACIPHLIKLLASLQASHSRRVFIVFDNADQFSDALQNDAFMLAHRIADEVGCSLIVSLREESYWKNKNYGALSAFHSMSFYVEAPDVMAVIAKRFAYATDLLRSSEHYVVPSTGLGVTHDEALQVFQVLREMVLGNKEVGEFLRALSPGEVRRPLSQLATFLFSGHTNIDAVLRGVRIKKRVAPGFHEFVKAVALGDRESFNENKSDIVNLFALDGAADASNVNRLAIMGFIHVFRRETSSVGLGFVPISQVLDVCAEHGVARDTTRAIIQFMNTRRLLEVDQQNREALGQSTYVRTTRAFDYYLMNLGKSFVYVDLVLPRTSIPVGLDFEMLERLSAQIYASGAGALPRMEKLQLRIERAIHFADFLKRSADGHSMFMKAGLIDPLVINFMNSLQAGLERESAKVLRNAQEAFAPRTADQRKLAALK